MKKIFVVLAAIFLLVIMACSGGGGGNDSSTPQSNDNDSRSSTIDTSGGSLTTPSGDAALNIPAGALSSATPITIALSSRETPPGNLVGVYDFTPDGQTFNSLVTISIKYDPDSIPEGVNQSDLKLAYLSDSGSWEVISDSTVDTTNHIISGQTNHFSTYSVVPSDKVDYGYYVGEFSSVEAKSNGSTGYVSNEYNSYNDYNTGMKWQCVEYVNRYYLQIYSKQIRIAGRNANDYYQNATERGLVAYPNDGSEPPQVGDIIVSEYGSTGHVAIVREVNADKIYVIQQNYCENAGDNKYPLIRSGNHVYPFGGKTGKYTVKGWVRSNTVPTYTISGKVTGAVVSGVSINLTGTTITSTTTDSSGNYSFTGRSDGNYTLTPSMTGYTFSPSSTALTVSGANVTTINFTATANTVTYSMSGTIHIGSNSGAVLSGATVSIAGLTATTSSTGTFSITGIPSGTYAFSVSKSGYDTYTNSAYYVGSNQTGLSFYLTQPTITYSMSGTIHVGSNSGAVLTGATVSIAGLTATTGSAGTFTITGISAGTYAFSVSKAGYDTYTNSAYYVGSDQTGLNFYLTPSGTSGDYTSAHIGTLKYVPAGSFQRDATSTNISTVSAFRMSEYEITRAQFLAIMGVDPSYTTSFSTGTSDPVQLVTWYDAVEFCNKLSIAEGLTPVYTITGRTPATGYPITDASVTPTWANNGYRLPTEMEWMWAAMGATAGATGYLKAFAGSTGSNSIGDYAWYSGNSASTTHPVGTKLPNELWIYDMSGNVWEWNWDWYGAPPTGIQTNYRGAASGTSRVIRGGSWYINAANATVANRRDGAPGGQAGSLGFRVVRP